ncbi:MAG: transferase [Hormoscilla sp. SP5CHS1]|nr:transferase [Hormoscilla sp. SP12CHS1]MBC6454695.1 transferase [Hormoscilla sp. SP5CHS1]
MYFPPLQPLKNSQYKVSGDVLIDPSAAIAPGVLLQADRDSRIIIAAGVCIGMGTIVHGSKGTVAVESGASLGAGVLIVGKGKIGANACVGSMTTIINSDIEQGQVVPPGSLLGEDSRKLSKDEQSKDEKYVVTELAQYTAIKGAIVNTVASIESASSKPETRSKDPIVNTPAVQASINSAVARNASANTPKPSMSPGRSMEEEGAALTAVDNNSTSDTPSAKEADLPLASEEASENQAIVYGQEQLDELMGTLFPHNKSWSKRS